MKKAKYLKWSNLPPSLGLLRAGLLWLLLERFNAPLWLYGVIFTFHGLCVAADLYRMFTGDAVDVVGNDK